MQKKIKLEIYFFFFFKFYLWISTHLRSEFIKLCINASPAIHNSFWENWIWKMCKRRQRGGRAAETRSGAKSHIRWIEHPSGGPMVRQLIPPIKSSVLQGSKYHLQKELYQKGWRNENTHRKTRSEKMMVAMSLGKFRSHLCNFI